MYVLSVIPFSRSAPAGTLSYRSRTEVLPGTLVRVTLRRKAIHALVVECVTVAEAKAVLKAASFTLSGSKPAEEGSLPPALIAAASLVARYHATPLGTTLASLFAPFIKEEFPLPPLVGFTNGSKHVVHAVEGTLESRAEEYRTRMAPVLSAGATVLFVVPTLAELSYWSDIFADLDPVVLSGTLPAKARHSALKKASEAGRLVLSTPAFSFVPLAALGFIVVERVSAGGYRMPQRPYLDMRVVLRALAEARAVPLATGDYPLPLEYRPSPASALTEVPSATPTLYDTRRPKDDQTPEAWHAVPSPVRSDIAKTLEKNGRVLVLAVRKGYAPSVVCRDCGHVLTDDRGVILTFSMRGGERILRTADGISERSADAHCPSCGGWNLLPLGIGIERVVEELREAFPEARIVEASREVRTQTAARTLLKDAEQPGTIVVGTESVLPWLTALRIPVFTLGVLVSADSLLAVPFWRARERLVRLGLFLAQRAVRTVIASRMPEDTAVATIADPAGGTFFSEETMLRKALGYPPFGTLIAIQAEAPRNKLEQLSSLVHTALGDVPYTVLPDRSVSTTVLRRSFVLHLPVWPDTSLSERLQHLPLTVRTLVDPEAF